MVPKWLPLTPRGTPLERLIERLNRHLGPLSRAVELGGGGGSEDTGPMQEITTRRPYIFRHLGSGSSFALPHAPEASSHRCYKSGIQLRQWSSGTFEKWMYRISGINNDVLEIGEQADNAEVTLHYFVVETTTITAEGISGVRSVFGRWGTVVAESGDYAHSQLTDAGSYTHAQIDSHINDASIHGGGGGGSGGPVPGSFVRRGDPARWAVSGRIGAGTAVNHTTGGTALFATPLWVPRTCLLTDLGFNSGASSTNAAVGARCSLYTDDGDGYPLDLVAGSETGHLAIPTASLRSFTFPTPISLTAGLYWAVVQTSQSFTVRGASLADAWAALGGADATSFGVGYNGGVLAYGAHPATFPSGAAIVVAPMGSVYARFSPP